MAKKKLQSDQPSAVSSQPEATQDELARAARVLVSQGRAQGLLACMGAARIKRLAGFTNAAGEVQQAAVIGVREVFEDFYDEQKAVVDSDNNASPPETPAA